MSGFWLRFKSGFCSAAHALKLWPIALDQNTSLIDPLTYHSNVRPVTMPSAEVRAEAICEGCSRVTARGLASI